MPERREPSFEWVDMPVGRKPIPSWCTGAHVDWMDGWGNPPEIKLKGRNIFGWDMEWVHEGDCFYRSYSGDGRMEQHAHSGMLSWDDERKAWLSTQDEGYAGRAFTITMKDGHIMSAQGKGRSNRFDPWTPWSQKILFSGEQRTVILRGPWHTSPPAGWIPVSVYDTETDYNRHEHYGPRNKWWRPWYNRTLCFGLNITVDLYKRIAARYLPTVRFAAVTYSYGGPFLEPVREDWDAPKHWILQRQHTTGAAA